MVTLIIYDITAKDKKFYNRIKRVFYYHLNKKLGNVLFLSKSVILIEDNTKIPIIEGLIKEINTKNNNTIKAYIINASEILEI